MTATKSNLACLGTKHFAVLLASSALLLAGCSNMETTATGTPVSAGDGSTLTGRVHGGMQPVAGANVYLYAVGQSGVGSTPTLLATTTTSTTNGTGSFSFIQSPTLGASYPSSGNEYACPGPPNADILLYVLSKGGNTTGNTSLSVNNSAAVFLAPVGYCMQVSNSTFVDVSEVTTAAMVASTGQFINPSTEGIGNDGILVAYTAIGNAFKTVANLVSAATGIANSSLTLSPGSGAVGTSSTSSVPVAITATPESAKLNTIANILAACSNQNTSTSATNCSTLFTNAVPPASASTTSQPGATFPTAADTLQAALYMYINPTDTNNTNRTNLFNLQPGTGAPYQPTISTLPTDWTIGIVYASSNVCGTGNSTFFSHPYDLNVDAGGNLWIVNNSGGNSALVEISPTGVPETCVTLGGSSEGGGVVDSNTSAPNVWYVDNAGTNVVRYTPSTQQIRSYSTATLSTGSGTASISPIHIAADGSGNIYFTGTSGGTGYVYKIQNGAAASGVSSPIPIGIGVGPTPSKLFPDAVGDIWVTSGAGYVTELSTSTAVGATNGYVATQFTVPSPSYGIVVGSSPSTSGSNLNNRVYVVSQDPAASLTVLEPSGSSYTTLFTTSTNTAGLSNPAGSFLDGAQNSWVSNNGAETSNGLYGVSVVSTTGTAISATGNANGAYQKAVGYFNKLRGMAVDTAGNVWTTSDNGYNIVTEIVGAAVPVYAPYAVGLAQGTARFQSIP